MRVYHGTDVATAELLAANPRALDMARGEGEFGRGFYTGNRPALAMSQARGRFGERGRVLEITIADADYESLTKIVMDFDTVWSTAQRLRQSGKTSTHTFGRDVVEGAFETIPHATQYKFESERAAAVLHRSEWKVLS